MKVFMTGATGFVGLNIVKALLDAGHSVKVLVRTHSNRRFLDMFPVEVVVGDLTDISSVASMIGDAECVIHTAGDTSCDKRDWSRLWGTNVEGTRTVLAAARRCGVRRLVYTSTTSTIGCFNTLKKRAVETTPLTGFRARSPYGQTKLEAERLLLENKAGDPECIILNLAEVLGPYDHTLQWGRMVLAVAAGRVPFVPPGSGSFCPASDVALAHVAALTQGRPGERYILGGNDVSFANLLKEIERIAGGSARPVDSLPYAWHTLVSVIKGWQGRPVTVDSYRMMVFCGKHLFDDSKARSELGYQTRSLQTAIEECYSWYQEHGFLSPAPTREPLNSDKRKFV